VTQYSWHKFVKYWPIFRPQSSGNIPPHLKRVVTLRCRIIPQSRNVNSFVGVIDCHNLYTVCFASNIMLIVLCNCSVHFSHLTVAFREISYLIFDILGQKFVCAKTKTLHMCNTFAPVQSRDSANQIILRTWRACVRCQITGTTQTLLSVHLLLSLSVYSSILVISIVWARDIAWASAGNRSIQLIKKTSSKKQASLMLLTLSAQNVWSMYNLKIICSSWRDKRRCTDNKVCVLA